MKCNRTVCRNEGVYPHADIAIGHDGQPARYCPECATLINRANRPMAGYTLVPTTIEDVASVLAVRLGQPLELPADSDDWLGYIAARDRAVADLGTRLLRALPARERARIHAKPAREPRAA